LKQSTTSLWNKINRIKGGKLKTGIRKLVIGHQTVMNPQEVADKMARLFPKLSNRKLRTSISTNEARRQQLETWYAMGRSNEL
jgi:hypothetical protein